MPSRATVRTLPADVVDAIFGLDVGLGGQGVDPVGDLDGADRGRIQAAVILGEEFDPLDLVGALGGEGVDAVGDFDGRVEEGVGLLGGGLRVLGGDGGFHLAHAHVLGDGGEGGAGLLDGGGHVVRGHAVAVLRGGDGEGFTVLRDDDRSVLHFRGQGGVRGGRELLDGFLTDGDDGVDVALGEQGADERGKGRGALHGGVGGLVGVDRDARFVERGLRGLAFDGEGHVGGVGALVHCGDDLVSGHARDGGPGDGGAGQGASGVVGGVDDAGAYDEEDEGAHNADRPSGFQR